MAKVSVIIPIYNGASYINSIFEQIEAQTHRDMEVVFINDGSTDDSAKIIDEAIKAHGGSITYRLVSQENTGQGGARNRGIEEASGDYLLFMDQDDMIKEDYIEKLLDVAIRDDCDMVISGYEHVSRGGEVKEHVELVNNEWCRFMNITPWGKIYKRDFVERENIRFLPVPLGEDIYFNVLCYSHARSVSYTDYVGYRWVINEASVSNTVHRAVTDESNVMRLFDKMALMDRADVWMKDPQFEYFMLKTGIFHILYAAKGTGAKKLIEYKNEIFDWLEAHMPGISENSLISWNKPDGERNGVKRAVFVFVMLRRCRLENLFLRLFCRV